MKRFENSTSYEVYQIKRLGHDIFSSLLLLVSGVYNTWNAVFSYMQSKRGREESDEIQRESKELRENTDRIGRKLAGYLRN